MTLPEVASQLSSLFKIAGPHAMSMISQVDLRISNSQHDDKRRNNNLVTKI